MLREVVKEVPDKIDFLKVSIGNQNPHQDPLGRMTMGRSQKNKGMFPLEIQMVLCNRRNHAEVPRPLSSTYSPCPRQGESGRESIGH